MPLDQPFVLPEARPLADAVAAPVDVDEERRILKHLIAKLGRGERLDSLDVQWYAYICGCGAMPIRRLSL